MAGLLPPLKPIAIKELHSFLFIDKGHLDVFDGAFVVLDNPSFDRMQLAAGYFINAEILTRTIPGCA